MCLIIFDWQPDQHRMLTLASNRDEFYARPSLDAEYWEGAPKIFGGRDLQMGGTWLAVSQGSRLAAITNYRSPDKQEYARSRGEIPYQFLLSSSCAHEFARNIPKHEYAGFNALLFDGDKLVYCHNRGEEKNDLQLAPGQYGLSNHLLNTPWPKVRKTKPALLKARQERNKAIAAEHLLTALQNQEHAPLEELPKTGIAQEIEHMLSPAFISSPNYGTRTSSVIIIENTNKQESGAKPSETHSQLKHNSGKDIFFLERQYQGEVTKYREKLKHISGE